MGEIRQIKMDGLNAKLSLIEDSVEGTPCVKEIGYFSNWKIDALEKSQFETKRSEKCFESQCWSASAVGFALFEGEEGELFLRDTMLKEIPNQSEVFAECLCGEASVESFNIGALFDVAVQVAICLKGIGSLNLMY